jgi:acyl-coenzyme A synthetase/AMP-(fatty) acid ligase
MVDGQNEPIVLQNYNRMFIMKDNTPNTMHLWAAAARAITPAMKKKRLSLNQRQTAVPDANALIVLTANGETINGKPISIDNQYPDKDIVTKKVTNLEPDWYIYIQNKDLHLLSDAERQFIVDNLDMEKYLKLLNDAYTRNWMNKVPGVDYSDIEADTEEEESDD